MSIWTAALAILGACFAACVIAFAILGLDVYLASLAGQPTQEK